METSLTFPLTLLATIFICSFIILIVLCRYKSLRKNATKYVKKLTRSDLRHRETELTEKGSLVRKFTGGPKEGALRVRCHQLLDKCRQLDLSSASADGLTQPHIQQIQDIIQMAQAITDDGWNCPRAGASLLQASAGELLAQVSAAMAAMESKLANLRCTAMQKDGIHFMA